MIVDIGLVNKTEGLYDIFRNRIMFPIHNSNGNPIGFSGRIYGDSNKNKYVNTKETVIFM
jgi:DNA primase